MKNFIYKIELYSGFYESYFFKQVKAKNEKDAIIQIVSYFKDLDESDAITFLNNQLGKRWSINSFWKDIDTRFENSDGSVGYNLIWVKKVRFDLDAY